MAVTQVTVVEGGVIVDTETGEILDWSARDPKLDRWEWLGRQRIEARAQEKSWTSIGRFYARLMLGHLDDEQLERIDIGTVRMSKRRGRDTRTCRPVEGLELTRKQQNAIAKTAIEYDRAALLDLEEDGKIPPGTVAAMTVGKVGDPYCQVDELRRPAPRMDTELREAR